MPADPARIEHLALTVAADGADAGRRFGEAVARELQALLPADACGQIGAVAVRVTSPSDPAVVARAIRDAVLRGGR